MVSSYIHGNGETAMRRASLTIGLFVAASLPALGQPGDNDVFVRVVDVGSGLCCVVKMPGDHYMIYDAGNYTDGGTGAFDAISEVIPAESEIDLMVLSHSDADHLGAVDEICDAYTVRRVIRAGLKRSTGTWDDANIAIETEKDDEDCIDINMKYFEFPPGGTYRFGETFVTMVFGLHKPPPSWGLTSNSEKRNAGSIVIRLVYKGKSILFCGDTVGRHIDGPADQHIAAEKAMVDNSAVIPIDSDVIIAPHHGADNGSSTRFIEAVSPEYVVFSAGHKYDHPRKAAAKRYTDAGVSKTKMFRTDRGDDEGTKEWKHESVNGHRDRSGDDDVDILIKANGDIEVKYRH
jgi:competence protein ComEC